MSWTSHCQVCFSMRKLREEYYFMWLCMFLVNKCAIAITFSIVVVNIVYKQYWNETCFVCESYSLQVHFWSMHFHVSTGLASQRNCVYHLLQCFTQDFYYFESDLGNSISIVYSRFCTETVTLSWERSTFAILSIISCCPRVSYKISNLNTFLPVKVWHGRL